MGGRAALFVLGLLLALGAVEVGVRWVAPQDAGDRAAGTLLRGPLTTPGEHRVRTAEYDVTVPVNASGFVDGPWEGGRRPLVAVIGDSFVQAAQVPLDAGFGRRLAQALGEGEVRSLGVPGAGTATALGLYEHHARAWRPDLVVLGFLVGNDVLNNHPLLEGKDDKPFYALQGGRLVPVVAEDVVAPGGPLWRLSHAWRLVARAHATREAAARKLALGRGMPIDLRVHDPAPDPVWEEAWGVTAALVAELAARCARDGTELVVVLFPTAAEATRAGREALVAAWPAAAGWDLGRARARAAAAFAPVPTVDIAGAFVAAEGPEPLYFPVDGHWTARGHAVAAEATAPFVKARLAARAGRR